MADSRNFAALEWVIGEIDETLKQARQSLEAYVENPQDSTRIRFCLTHIHQVHGSLQMVEFFGAALLAEEMEAIAQALMNGEVSNTAEAHEVLMRAILQLPIYLDQVKAKRNDDPGSLLPILNDLRAARGSSLLSESQFFNPDISAAKVISGKRNAAQANAAQFKAIVEKLRQMYQYAAAGVIRGVKIDENLDYLQKVFTRLHTLTSGTGRQRLWDIALAVVEGLNSEQIEISVSLKALLRQLDKEIRLLSQHGVKALNSFTREELIKNLLYYVARSEGTSPRIERLRHEFALDTALPEQLSLSGNNTFFAGPDPETMRTVVGALNDELSTIKEALDESLSGQEPDILTQALPVMKRVADTLAVLGVADLRKQILTQVENLEMALAQDDVNHGVLTTVADEIMSIEHSLALLADVSSFSGSAQSSHQLHISEAQETVLREARNGLEHTKDAIIEYIASQWDRSHLVGVPQQLEEIRGGLAMIPLSRPAAILKGCGRFIETELLGKAEAPDWSSLDTLADAIASVEYFLERLSGNREDDDDVLLTLAEESIDALGYGIAGVAPTLAPGPKSTIDPARVLHKLADVERVDIEALPAAESAAESEDSAEIAADLTAAAEEADMAAQQETDEQAEGGGQQVAGEPFELQTSELPAAVAEQPTEDDTLASNDQFSENAVHNNAADADETAIDLNAADVVTDTPAVVETAVETDIEGVIETATEPAVAPEASAASDTQEDSDDEFDAEILEIFIEEAGEVLEAIDEFFPQWAADFGNTDALIEFRRAFHTLKGSGRMVGAQELGELAWAIESVLNRVLDGTVEAHPVQVELIARVRAVVPEFLHAFEHKLHNPKAQQGLQLAAWADAICRGEHPQALLSADTSSDPRANSSDDTGQTEDTNDTEEADRTGDTDHPQGTGNTDSAASSTSFASTDSLTEPEEVTSATDAQAAAAEETEDEDESSEYNAILWEIFGTEAITHLQVVEQFIDEMQESAPLFTPPSEGMQRALHTLKGSAHMADVHDVAELATPLERFAKELRTYQVNIDQDILQLFRDGVTYTHEALTQIREGGTASIAKLSQFLARVAELRDLSVVPLIRQQEQEQREEKTIDPKLLSIFMAEEMNLLLDADVLIAQWRQAPESPDKLDLVVTELNTLAKGAEHAHLPAMSAVSRQLAAIYGAAAGTLATVSADDFDTLLAAHEQLLDMVDAVAAGQNLQEPNEALDQQLQALKQQLSSLSVVEETEAETETQAEDEGDSELLATLELSPTLATADADDAVLAQDVAEDFVAAVGEWGDEEPSADKEPSADREPAAESDEEPLAEYDEEPSANHEEPSGNHEGPEAESIDQPSLESLLELESPPLTEAPYEIEVLADVAVPSYAVTEYAADSAVDDHGDEDIDPEIIEIFLEEADELMEDIEQAVHDWSEDWSRTDCSEELQRALHTLKGGARLSGMTALGNVAHDFETDVIHLSDSSAATADFFVRLNQYQDQLLKGIAVVKAGMAGEASLVDALTAELGAPADMGVVATAADDLNAAPAVTAQEEPQSDSSELDSSELEQAEVSASDLSFNELSQPDFNNGESGSGEKVLGQVVPFTPKDMVPVVSSGDYQLPPSRSVSRMGGGSIAAPIQTKRNAPQEVVKVSAELLEELVNLAGETSINRGRMEEQVSELGFAIEEMDATISRLQEQLRRLDIETEAQVLFRQEQMAEQDDFDPLEMDRYSQLQQLSRSLIESASDLMDLKATLVDKTRDTETLLLQQARINTDLQEGLMRSRMVPFSRLVPRLRRIVRQVSSELDKRVNFELDNVEGELDRTVLERMVAPLEHMLRNAVDHGIETPRQRVAAGKSESGRIVLTVGREGSDVILRLIDDGRGINLKRVREKAIERGLMSAEAKLSDREVMQFILHAGFSTADSVTQISGRGVGMDVVHSEIKQLGGAVVINSREGEGTEFTIRLPFTVSVNRALMVRIGDDRYAIPLNTIEGIVRVSPFELEHYYHEPEARFEYAGEQYKVNYLGTLLNSDARPKLEGQAMPLPVVLVRTAQQAVAIQVDMLMGSREVVVKSLGPQFSTVLGLSGATVMGDGSVVVILDPHAMIRQTAALAHDMTALTAPAEALAEASVKTVMVVDDSVTVRKVTSRFLEREGYEVLTAKDGADAMLQLQDRIPDVMLLDIEMPRMDGFEVAKNIRSSSRLRHIPIIMITSRTGDKHRERAFSLGVDRYMGKPYQEDKLLHNILVVTGDLVEMENKHEHANVSLQE